MNFKEVFDEYKEEGCVKIENFLSPQEVETMRQGMRDAIANMTDDMYVHSAYSDSQTKAVEDYYINSGDKVAYFFESDAFDSEGNLLVDKEKALNKVAYAVHWWNPHFKSISFSQKVKDLVKAFGYQDPVVAHSMLIFKHPKIGEIFPPHQDSTFLYTEPPSSLGIWLPLESANLENGCLWFLPGSHKDIIHKRYVRVPGGDPLMHMRGEIPPHDNSKYVPIPANVGDCVLIHGSVLHKSGRNQTMKPRVAYTFHVVENGNEWSKENWLQPTERLPFPSIYNN